MAAPESEIRGGGIGRLASLPRLSRELMVLVDAAGRIIDAAPSIEPLLGIARQDAIGRPFTALLAAADFDQISSSIERSLRHRGMTQMIAFQAPSPDGPLLDFEGRITNCLDDAQLAGILVGAIDVTQHVRVQRQLRHIVQASIEGIIVHRGGPPLYANDTMARMVNLRDRHELMREPSVAPYLHPDDRAMVADNIEGRLRGEPVANDYEFRLITRDGRTVWVDCRASTVDWDGKPAVLATLYDITSRKAEEVARRETEILFTKVFQVSPEIITLTDLETGRYIDVNDRFAELLGYRRDEVLGRTAADIDIWGEPGFRSKILDRLKYDGGFRDMETSVRSRSGELRDISFSAETFAGQNRNILLIVGHDITEQKRYQQELRESKAAAEMADRAKGEFLANMSHELRTPLNAIIGFAEVLEKQLFGPLGTERYVQYAGDIRLSGAHLLDIINDILDISKLEAGKMELHEAEVSVEQVVDACVRLVRERARVAEIEITTELPDKLPLLRADQRLVKQMLLNLLSNAIKFTPAGGRVVISAALTDEGDCAIAVSDTGIGMDETGISVAFTPFGQVASPLARSHQGSGLGVPLVKSLMERHDGRLDLKSSPGAGTTATMIFPRKRARL